MASYSLDFEELDDEILDILGDDITVFNPGGGSQIIKGEFEFKFMEDELGDMVDIRYPTIIVNNSIAHLFDKKIRVEFDDVIYTVLKQLPSDVGKTLIILRT